MTSIRMPFISPFPVECEECGLKIEEDQIFDSQYVVNQKRELYLRCFECNSEYKITQKAIVPDYEIEIVDDG